MVFETAYIFGCAYIIKIKFAFKVSNPIAYYLNPLLDPFCLLELKRVKFDTSLCYHAHCGSLPQTPLLSNSNFYSIRKLDHILEKIDVPFK